jgi:hypothetical protein
MIKRFLMAIPFALVLMGSGCEKQGPLEEAGEEIDEAVEDTKRKIEDATD